MTTAAVKLAAGTCEDLMGSDSRNRMPDFALISIPEAARLLGVSEPTIYRSMADGALRPTRIRGRTLFEPLELQRFVEAGRAQQDGGGDHGAGDPD